MSALRIIVDAPASGAWNMAVDEALVETAATTGGAALRLYRWSEPTLSLGYFQAAADRKIHPPSLNCPLVRRASGGGAILHDRELTYSLAIARPSVLASVARELYDIVHDSLIAVLCSFGIQARLAGSVTPPCASPLQGQVKDEPFLCFERRTCTDIICGPAKIVGSAQRRRRGAVLQHGSILLSQSHFAPELPGIREVTGKTIGTSELIGSWPPLVAEKLGVVLRTAELSPLEFNRAKSLEASRFASDEYLHRR
jgi:lipoate-protein ligase A